MKAIKEIFSLEYETENLHYSLPEWYNKLLDKTLEELTNSDLGRMLRQNILKDIAVDKIIERFLIDPFEGEKCPYDFLKKLIDNFEDVAKNKRMNELVAKVQEVMNNIDSYEWDEYVPEDKKEYMDNLSEFLQKVKALEAKEYVIGDTLQK